MLKPDQISAQIAEIEDGRLSVEEFERWFRRASRNFHAYPDESARTAIFEIENVLSGYHEDLDETAARKELAEAIRPFETVVARMGQQAILATNYSGVPISMSSGNNNNVHFNVAA